MKYGARNKITAKVTEVQKGTVMCQVKLVADGPVPLASVMTLDSLAELGLKKGDSVTVLVKAVNVLLVREGG